MEDDSPLANSAFTYDSVNAVLNISTSDHALKGNYTLKFKGTLLSGMFKEVDIDVEIISNLVIVDPEPEPEENDN